jgi:branched-chain amino acid aminotransferase
MLDLQGFVAETNATHLFVVTRGAVATSRTVACPEGITRTTVLDLCREHDISCSVGDLSMTEVYRADEVFCSGTMGELAGVIRVDGRTIGTGEVGPVTKRLSKLYAECVAAAGEPVV